MIHLFAGGRSVKDIDFGGLGGLKVFINWAFRHFDKEIDVLIWGDDFVGNGVREHYKEKPKFKLVCYKRSEGLAKDWVDETFEYQRFSFTLLWAVLWLREKHPEKKIIIYGLDKGDGKDYYDGWNKGMAFHPTPSEIERVSTIERCYKQLDELTDRENIFTTKGSAYKGFTEYDN